MAKKLAVTCAGAVSLGSYEAGVLYELLYALKQHNQQPDLAEDEKVYLDVMTGASAGGLSVSLAAQKLLYVASALDEPYANPLYRAWVEDVDIQGLLQLSPDESPACSLFSSDLVEQVVRKYLLARYASTAAPAAEPHPALGPEQTLGLGLALSNLCGVDYTRPTLAAGAFTYTRYQDQLTAILGGAEDTAADWGRIQKAAVSCAAFPFAFRVQDLERGIECYNDSPFFDPTCFGRRASRSFTYTDGGLFQNQPLGLAKNLVDRMDGDRAADGRAYLFVAPQALASTADQSFCASAGNFAQVTVRLLLSIFGQARFEDWIEAEKVNDRLAAFHERARDLHRVLRDGPLPSPAGTAFQTLLTSFFPGEAEAASEPARRRLQNRFQAEYAQLQQARGNDSAELWLATLTLLEKAARLEGKEEMYIYAITTDAKELAGSPLLWFLGFFDQRYRDHDYDLGRLKAQAFLADPNAGRSGPLSPVRYQPRPVRPLASNLTGLSVADVPLSTRRQLRDRLQDRAGIMLKEARLPFLTRQAVQRLFLHGKINELLAL